MIFSIVCTTWNIKRVKNMRNIFELIFYLFIFFLLILTFTLYFLFWWVMNFLRLIFRHTYLIILMLLENLIIHYNRIKYSHDKFSQLRWLLRIRIEFNVFTVLRTSKDVFYRNYLFPKSFYQKSVLIKF